MILPSALRTGLHSYFCETCCFHITFSEVNWTATWERSMAPKGTSMFPVASATKSFYWGRIWSSTWEMFTSREQTANTSVLSVENNSTTRMIWRTMCRFMMGNWNMFAKKLTARRLTQLAKLWRNIKSLPMKLTWTLLHARCARSSWAPHSSWELTC